MSLRRTVGPAFTLLGLSALLTACMPLPGGGVQARLMDLSGESRTLSADPAAERIVKRWPREKWWVDFHNAELNRVIEAALAGSPTLKVAVARLSQAEAAADYRAADLLPSVGARADLHRRRFSSTDFYGPAGGHTYTGAYLDPAVFNYHLDLWGKDKANLEAALGQEKAEASELAAARLLLSTAVARAYFLLGSTEEAIAWAHARVEKSAEKLRLARLRWERGLEAQDPVHEDEQKLQDAHQRESHLHAEAQTLRNRLAALAGRGPDWGREIRISAGAYAERFPLPERLPLGLLAHRPDVAAALWRAEAAARLVKVAETNFYPDVDLVGFAGLRSLNLKDLFLSHGASVAYSIGPTVTLPIFEGGRLEAELKHAQAAHAGAVEGYNAALLAAVQQVADALAHWRETLDHDATQERALAAAEAEAELAERRFQAGLSTRDGEIDAATRLIEQRLKASELRSEHLQAAVGLIAALGGGYENPQTQPASGTQP
ncbi:efflux transporter outer membrane subunit [Methylococcus sp. EFPC2]|uniref:efflux transporter outer membrane subunit n=1 Tax=Methylococcus sp. EFPC2 TaxID=2812648 RepID=UPI001967A7B8|nr:efflux transporter outer membrane subunit [Methylococcus sp. EFPC2]QSA98907.1 efflux transporter outer membrane subunit [Methylococcus sp. EFPC2]